MKVEWTGQGGRDLDALVTLMAPLGFLSLMYSKLRNTKPTNQEQQWNRRSKPSEVPIFSHTTRERQPCELELLSNSGYTLLSNTKKSHKPLFGISH